MRGGPPDCCVLLAWPSWNTLLGWAVRSGRSKLVEDLGLEMARRGVRGDVTTNNIRLRHLLSERPEDGVAFFEQLRADGIRYVASTYPHDTSSFTYFRESCVAELDMCMNPTLQPCPAVSGPGDGEHHGGLPRQVKVSGHGPSRQATAGLCLSRLPF
jgi:hypothetical protein